MYKDALGRFRVLPGVSEILLLSSHLSFTTVRSWSLAIIHRLVLVASTDFNSSSILLQWKVYERIATRGGKEEVIYTVFTAVIGRTAFVSSWIPHITRRFCMVCGARFKVWVDRKGWAAGTTRKWDLKLPLPEQAGGEESRGLCAPHSGSCGHLICISTRLPFTPSLPPPLPPHHPPPSMPLSLLCWQAAPCCSLGRIWRRGGRLKRRRLAGAPWPSWPHPCLSLVPTLDLRLFSPRFLAPRLIYIFPPSSSCLTLPTLLHRYMRTGSSQRRRSILSTSRGKRRRTRAW